MDSHMLHIKGEVCSCLLECWSQLSDALLGLHIKGEVCSCLLECWSQLSDALLGFLTDQLQAHSNVMSNVYGV
jgi:hypothetical protein